jgi:hypothetical protein
LTFCLRDSNHHRIWIWWEPALICFNNNKLEVTGILKLSLGCR